MALSVPLDSGTCFPRVNVNRFAALNSGLSGCPLPVDWEYHLLADLERTPEGGAILTLEHDDTGTCFTAVCPAAALPNLIPFAELFEAWLRDPLCNAQPLAPIDTRDGYPRFSVSGAHHDYPETPAPARSYRPPTEHLRWSIRPLYTSPSSAFLNLILKVTSRFG